MPLSVYEIGPSNPNAVTKPNFGLERCRSGLDGGRAADTDSTQGFVAVLGYLGGDVERPGHWGSVAFDPICRHHMGMPQQFPLPGGELYVGRHDADILLDCYPSESKMP